MSKTPKNKKYLELQGVRVYHNKKDNTIQLITTDPDLTGKPFQITLSNGTPTDQSLRELLLEKEVLNEEEVYPQYYVPTFAERDEYTSISTAWNEIPVGWTKFNQKLIINVTHTPHTLIAGGTGQGKTNLLNNFFLHALEHSDKWKICALHPIYAEFSYLEKYPESLYDIGNGFNESVEQLYKLEKTLEERQAQMTLEKVTNFQDFKENTPAIMVVVDETLTLLSKALYAKGELAEERNVLAVQAREIIHKLARLGRAAGIFLVLATQRPDADIFTGELKANLDNRIAVGRMDRTTSTLVLGVDVATQTPNQVKGRAILRHNTELIPFQIYHAPLDRA